MLLSLSLLSLITTGTTTWLIRNGDRWTTDSPGKLQRHTGAFQNKHKNKKFIRGEHSEIMKMKKTECYIFSDGVYTMDQGSKERPSPRSLSQAFMQVT